MGYPCPPPNPDRCPQVCAPPPPLAPCRIKPIMRGLHNQQTKGIITISATLMILSGFCTYYCLKYSRMKEYAEYYRRTDFEAISDEMARKGLFQAVPVDK